MPAALLCEALLSSEAARGWAVEPAIASVCFALWMNLFRGGEVTKPFHRRLFSPPFQFLTSGAKAISAYWLGVALWVALVPPPSAIESGCPDSASSLVRLCMECLSGLVVYDFVFFWLHLTMHLSPRLGRLIGHERHHEFDGAKDKLSETCFRTTHHSLVDGSLQVLCNILVQRYTLWGPAKTRLARWCVLSVFTDVTARLAS